MGQSLLSYINVLGPLFCAFTSLVIICFELRAGRDSANLPLRFLLGYLVCAVFNWTGIVLYYLFPVVFIYSNFFFMLTFIMAQVFFYAFVFHLTRLGDDARFSPLHYVAPAAITLLLLAVMIVTPYADQLRTIQGHGTYNGGSRLFFVVSNHKLLVRLAFSLVYTYLCFSRLIGYRRHVADYFSNTDKSSLAWVKAYLFLSLALIPIPLIGTLTNRDVFISSFFFMAQMLLLSVQYAFLSYHVIKGNYIVFDNPVGEQADAIGQVDASAQPDISSTPGKRQSLSRDVFEQYMQQERPFINPNLKITDLATCFNTNRNAVSSFINTEYGVNFNRLVNQYRLEEFNRLRDTRSRKHLSEQDLALMAGFGSFRNFRRFLDS